MRVLIHIEEERRDAPVLLALAELFRRQGDRVFLSTRRTTKLLLRSARIDAALVSSPETVGYEALPEITQKTKLYMLPTEGALFEEGPLMLKYGGGAKPERWERQIRSIHRFFLWGDYSRRMLLKTGKFREDQLVVAGAPRMDYFLPPRKKSSSRPFSIGLISDFVLINPVNRQHMFQKIDSIRHLGPYYQSPTRNIEDRLWVEHAAFRNWLNLIDECGKRGYKVTLRIHHREDRAAYDFLVKRCASFLSVEGQEVPFEEWLDGVSMVAGFNSTTFFEIVAADKPAVNLEGLLGPRLRDHTADFPQNHYPIMDFIPTPKSWDELFALTERVKGNPTGPHYPREAHAVLTDICAWPHAASALAGIVRTVHQDAAGKSLPSSGVADTFAVAKARAAEIFTFGLRRHPIGNSWFPLDGKRLARTHRAEIARYVQTAEKHPVTGIPRQEGTSCAASSSS